SDNQGIVHVIGPELGLTQPGMTIACGDTHTSTHGALGALAFGIGTSQVRDVLASQCLALDPLKVRRIDVIGRLKPGVYAKDVILTIIRHLGVHGGVGYAYEYGGATIDGMSIDERMTICNMSIEGGARAGYINPDETTYAFMKGRPFAPSGAAFDRAVAWWRELASDGKAAEARGLHEIFIDAGFEWRGAGCSMCLGMNPDRLEGREICASSSNRNFKGRQGSPTGRTLLMSPAMVAAAAIAGEVVDVRQMLDEIPSVVSGFSPTKL